MWCPDALRQPTVRYKEVIAGYMMQLRDRIVEYQMALADGKYDEPLLDEIFVFMRDRLSLSDKNFTKMDIPHRAVYLHDKLDRPLRVCGMVRNEGEPGGGPFVAVNPDGSASLQILESHQIGKNNRNIWPCSSRSHISIRWIWYATSKIVMATTMT